VTCKLYYLRQGGYVIVVVYVCLFVCLLTTSCKNFQMDLHEIFRGWKWAIEQVIKFWWQSGSQIRIRYRDTGETRLGRGIHCPSASSLTAVTVSTEYWKQTRFLLQFRYYLSLSGYCYVIYCLSDTVLIITNVFNSCTNDEGDRCRFRRSYVGESRSRRHTRLCFASTSLLEIWSGASC